MRSIATLAVAVAVASCSSHEPAPPREAAASTASALSWAVGANAANGRYWHASAALADGRVLIAGGSQRGETDLTSSAELFDPKANTWTAAGSLSQRRAHLGSGRLPSGKLLFAGGELSGGASLDVVDIYDPTTGTWSLGPSMLSLQGRSVVHVLPGGKLLLMGSFATPEVFDEKTWSWTKTGPVGVYRRPRMVTLGNGKVLACGGLSGSGNPQDSCVVYDPLTNLWAATGALKQARYQFLMAPLPGGGALVSGGDYGGAISTAERYDVGTGTWSAAPSMNVARLELGGGALPDGKVLAAFGGTTTAEVFDPVANVWKLASPGLYPRRETNAVPLPSGQVVFTGGFSPGFLSTAETYTQQALGETCGAAGDCASGFCVDGVCCGSACVGICSACNRPGKLGTCTVLDGVAPTAGKSCSPYDKCVAGACITSCMADGDCATGRYCASGACVPKLKLGLACAGAGQCESNFCVDGVCCGSACTGQCAACDVEGSFGTCAPIKGQPRGGRTACSGVAVGTLCGQQCNGIDSTSCTYPTTAIACGADACTDGVETRAGACDGAGLCKVTNTSCGVYGCAGTSCKTNCAVNTDCASGHYCASGTCLAVEGLGAACTSASACKTGFCVEGVCCGSASCGEGATCAAPKALGRCLKRAGSTCSIDEECATGFCTDGVCCDTRCDGQCEACSDSTGKGVCKPVLGKPRGTRKACEGEGDADVCKAKTCDGVERASCAAFVSGPDTVCGPSGCKGDSLTLESKCDGKGACVAGASSSCLPYLCAGRACATSCTRDSECGKGFRCSAGACVESAAACSDDGVSSIPAGGTPRSCAPYRCQPGGECGGSCETSTQCAPGAICDAAAKTCVAPTAPPGDDGGCSMGGRPSRGGSPFALAFVLGALFAMRRRAAFGAVFALFGALGCSVDRTPSKAAAIAPLRGHGPFAARLGDAEPLTSAAGGYRVDRGLSRIFPAKADGAWSMSTGGGELSVRALDVRPVGGEIVEHSLVFADAAKDTDVVLLQTGSLTEELRVLRSPAAPTTLRWSLATDLALRVERGRVLARDAGGTMLLQTEELDAVDAHGVRRVAQVELEGTTLVARFDLAGMTFPVVVDPAWSKPADMVSERREHASVRLADGRVLITGGVQASTTLNSAEIYDPVKNESVAIKPMTLARTGHSMVLLPDGSVLVGGQYGLTTELFDPKTGNWTDLGGSATRPGRLIGLDDGRVLGVGTSNCSGTGSAYFNPTTKAWSAGPTMKVARIAPMAVKLDDGRVFALGGDTCGVYTFDGSAEVFDPTTETWSLTGAPPSPHRNVSLAPVPGHKVLMLGGASNWAAALYDADTNAWTGAANMLFQRWNHAAAPLPNGRVIALGGQMTTTAEVWNPATNTWSPAGNLTRNRMRYPIAALDSGALLLSGGMDGVGTLSSQELFTLVPDGGTCSLAGECYSGFCVGGVCCNVACAGTCSACDLVGSVGKCSGLDGDPHYGRACVGGLACAAGVCKTTCSADADCASGRYCDGSGSCLAKKAQAGTCARNAECVSGACVDGVCCDRACNGQCEACNEPGNKGKCVGAVGAPRGTRTACTGAGLGTSCGPRCDGKDLTKCTYAPLTTFCSATACGAGVETHASFCDGAGACKDVSKDCGAYACGATQCKIACAADGDCAAGHYCKGTACAKIEDLGTTCTSGTTCKTGFCVDGVCCAAAACDPGNSCAATGHEGTCTKRNGTTCSASADCASGNCIDGVCCDRACDGQCEACDVAGSVGTCVAAVGAPHGKRAACDAGATPCAAKTCDGVDAKTCAAFAPTTVVCAPDKCSDAMFSRAARCDGKGVCSAPEISSCAPYACDDKGCFDSCATDASCAAGFQCLKGTCEARRDRCSEDLVDSIAADGTKTACGAYRCGPAGTCLTACATSSDCGGGFVCDGKACVAATAEVPPDQGGGCSTGSRSSASAWLLGLAAALVAARRRR